MYLNPNDPIKKWGEKLPHWGQGEAMQFVTFRLADAMPKAKLRRWGVERENWLKVNPKPWSPEREKEYHRLFTKKMEDWLDEGVGSCVLKKRIYREEIEKVLMFSQGEKVEHEAWVIMPNHVHLLFSPKVSMGGLVQTWKGVSARRIGEGSIWQKNYRDTLIRHGEHYANVVRYIRKNPKDLPEGTFTLWEGERAKAIQ